MIYCMLGNLGNVCKCEINYNKMAACEIENTATYMYCFIIGHNELNILCTFQNTMITVKWHVTCLPAFRNCISGILFRLACSGLFCINLCLFIGENISQMLVINNVVIPDVNYK